MNRWKLPTFLIAVCLLAAFRVFAWRPPSAVSGGPADKVVVEKHLPRMTLFRNAQELCSYHVASD